MNNLNKTEKLKVVMAAIGYEYYSWNSPLHQLKRVLGTTPSGYFAHKTSRVHHLTNVIRKPVVDWNFVVDTSQKLGFPVDTTGCVNEAFNTLYWHCRQREAARRGQAVHEVIDALLKGDTMAGPVEITLPPSSAATQIALDENSQPVDRESHFTVKLDAARLPYVIPVGDEHHGVFGTPRLNGQECPNCGEELWDSQPNLVLTTYPAQKHVKCYKCDYHGTRFI